MKKLKTLFIITGILIMGMVPSHAQETGNVIIHGFGGWGYGQTDGYLYMNGEEDGSYDHAQIFLNINARPMEKLNIVAQFGANQSYEGINFEFDYAFAEWTVSDLLKFRFGKVKHPYGNYGEILNVGTLRPFLYLPQGVYGSNGYVGKGINGIALTGALNTDTGWGLQYDVYWGQLRSETRTSNQMMYSITGNPAMLTDDIRHSEKNLVNMIGGRLIIATPLDGLSLSFSGYTGDGDPGADKQGTSGTQKSYGPGFEYITTNFWIRGEYKHFDINLVAGTMTMNIVTDSYYLEAAVKMFNNFQIAARYDVLDGTEDEHGDFLNQYVTHKDLAFGLNYWFNSNFAVKFSYHNVEGIRFAFPFFDDPVAFIGDTSTKKTRLIQFGAHFSF